MANTAKVSILTSADIGTFIGAVNQMMAGLKRMEATLQSVANAAGAPAVAMNAAANAATAMGTTMGRAAANGTAMVNSLGKVAQAASKAGKAVDQVPIKHPSGQFQPPQRQVPTSPTQPPSGQFQPPQRQVPTSPTQPPSATLPPNMAGGPKRLSATAMNAAATAATAMGTAMSGTAASGNAMASSLGKVASAAGAAAKASVLYTSARAKSLPADDSGGPRLANAAVRQMRENAQSLGLDSLRGRLAAQRQLTPPLFARGGRPTTFRFASADAEQARIDAANLPPVAPRGSKFRMATEAAEAARMAAATAPPPTLRQSPTFGMAAPPIRHPRALNQWGGPVGVAGWGGQHVPPPPPPPPTAPPAAAAQGPRNFAQKGQWGVELKDAFQKASAGGIGAGLDHMKGVIDSKLTSNFGGPVAGALKKAAGFFLDDLKAGLQEALADLGLDRPLTNMVKTGAEWESQMAKVNALTRSTKEQFESLKEASKTAVAGTGMTATQAARAQAKLAMGGLRDKDIEAALPHAMRLAAAAGVEVEEASSHLLGIQHGMGLGMEDLGRIADNLAFSLGESRVPLHELVDGFKYAMPSARATGQSLEQLTAIIVELSRQEITGSMSGTVYRNMIKKTADMSSEAREVMKQFGFNFQDYKGEFIGFDKVMDQIANNKKFQSLGRMGQADVLNTMFETRASMGFMAMSGKGDEIRRLTEQAGVRGVAAEMQTRKVDTLSGDWDRLKSEISSVFVSVYEAVGPIIRSIVKGFHGIINVVKGIASAIGSFFSGVVEFFGVVASTWKSLLSPVWEWFKEIGASLKEFFSPVVEWWTSVVGGFFDWIKNRWEDIKALPAKLVTPNRTYTDAQGNTIDEAQRGKNLDAQIAEMRKKNPQWYAPRGPQSAAANNGKPIDMDAQIKLSKAIEESRSNMNKHVGTTREAEAAARDLYAVQMRGGGQVDKMWHDTIMATKEYIGQVENLKKQGATAEQLAPLMKLVDESRLQEFNKRLYEAAGGYMAQTTASRDAALSSARLYQLQRQGGGMVAHAWHESTEATREYARFIDELAARNPHSPLVGQLRQGLANMRTTEFNKRLQDEAAKLWAESKGPLENFSTRIRDLDALQQRGLITARVYGDALRKAAEGAAGSAGITDLLTPWEQFQTQIQKVNQQFQDGLLDVTFYRRALFKAAEAYDQFASKGQGAGAAVFKGSAEAISAVDATFSRDNSGEKLAQQIMQQQLAALNNQVGEQRQHRLENQRGFDELIRALGLKDRLPK